MKTKTTKIKLRLTLGLMFLLPLGVFAVVPPDPAIYICGTGSVTLGYSSSSPYSLQTGDKVLWQEVTSTGTPIGSVQTKVYDASGPSSIALTLTGGTPITGEVAIGAAGDHYWIATVISALGDCTGDNSTVNVYMLPGLTVELSPSATTYCEAAPTKATFTAVGKPATGTTLPTGIGFTYDWSGSDATAGAVDGIDNSKFNMTANTADTYNIAVKANFTVPTGKLLKSSSGTDGCKVSATATFKVTPKPGAPTITVS